VFSSSPLLASDARGAGRPTKCAPPSVVRSSDVHGGELHGAVPSTQNIDSEIAVTLLATNPEGTGPPEGIVAPDRVGDAGWLVVAGSGDADGSLHDVDVDVDVAAERDVGVARD